MGTSNFLLSHKQKEKIKKLIQTQEESLLKDLEEKLNETVNIFLNSVQKGKRPTEEDLESIKGKYKGKLSTTQEFMENKQKEIEFEEENEKKWHSEKMEFEK
ncbi:hypothetical protein IT568_03230 [bacterium]|nr:hypothetical protein [bacterium]